MPIYSSKIETSIDIPCLNTTQTESYLGNECKGFIVFFCLQVEEKDEIDRIVVVREYPDVFLKEFSSLPLERELEFSIYLDPESSPISKAPYRMAPIKLAELKKQLEELLENGFIRPSASPWGLPCFL